MKPINIYSNPEREKLTSEIDNDLKDLGIEMDIKILPADEGYIMWYVSQLMKKSKAYMLVLLSFTFLAACSDDVKYIEGPLTNKITSKAEALEKVAEKKDEIISALDEKSAESNLEAFLKEIQNPKVTDLNNLKVRGPLILKTGANDGEGKAVFFISADLLDYDAFKKLAIKSPSYLTVDESTETITLLNGGTGDDGVGADGWLISATKLSLRAGETLKTDGLNLTVMTDALELQGTISTSAITSNENEGYRKAGKLNVSTIHLYNNGSGRLESAGSYGEVSTRDKLFKVFQTQGSVPEAEINLAIDQLRNTFRSSAEEYFGRIANHQVIEKSEVEATLALDFEKSKDKIIFQIMEVLRTNERFKRVAPNVSEGLEKIKAAAALKAPEHDYPHDVADVWRRAIDNSWKDSRNKRDEGYRFFRFEIMDHGFDRFFQSQQPSNMPPFFKEFSWRPLFRRTFEELQHPEELKDGHLIGEAPTYLLEVSDPDVVVPTISAEVLESTLSLTGMVARKKSLMIKTSPQVLFPETYLNLGLKDTRKQMIEVRAVSNTNQKVTDEVLLEEIAPKQKLHPIRYQSNPDFIQVVRGPVLKELPTSAVRVGSLVKTLESTVSSKSTLTDAEERLSLVVAPRLSALKTYEQLKSAINK